MSNYCFCYSVAKASSNVDSHDAMLIDTCRCWLTHTGFDCYMQVLIYTYRLLIDTCRLNAIFIDSCIQVWTSESFLVSLGVLNWKLLDVKIMPCADFHVWYLYIGSSEIRVSMLSVYISVLLFIHWQSNNEIMCYSLICVELFLTDIFSTATLFNVWSAYLWICSYVYSIEWYVYIVMCTKRHMCTA